MSEAVYSPGLEGVIAGETGISTVDEGLHYRGYSVEDLASHSTFEETAYLILYGELPMPGDLAAFQKRLAAAPGCRPKSSTRCARFPPTPRDGRDAHRLQPAAHWDPDTDDNSHDANLRKAERLLAQLPVIMAARHRLTGGDEPVKPDPKLSLAGNICGCCGARSRASGGPRRWMCR